MNQRGTIDAFLKQKRFAMVGVSRQQKDFSRALFRAFCEQGYDVVPVNPGAPEIEGRPCYPAVKDAADVTAALLMTPSKLAPAVVEDCAAAGINMIWLYRVGAGGVNPEAVEFCKSHGIQVIEGYCPFMFLQGGKFPHNFHAGILKIFGRYPAARATG